jgi:DNA-binding SARP family transcriptional activator
MRLDEIGFDFNPKAKEENWNLKFKKLQNYYGKQGHCESLCAVDPQLAIWVSTQRTRFKSGEMDPEQKMKLDEIGFDFNPKAKANEANWNLKFKKLQNHNGKQGHCESLCAVDPQLAIWVSTQRTRFKNGEMGPEH